MKVKKIISKDIKATIDTDVFVPVSIKYNDYKPSSNDFLFEYRYFNNNESFIEIRVNNNEKEIKTITIMSVKNIHKQLPIDLNNINCIEGSPIIDITGNDWKELSYCRLLDIKKNFKLYYSDEKFIALFEENSKIIKKIKMPYLELLLNIDNIIIGFIVNEIPNINLFEESIFAN